MKAPVSYPNQSLAPELVPSTVSNERERILRELMPFDYNQAVSEGLIDMYVYNPRTGEDGLLHTLAGSTTSTPGGGMTVSGFHHEPSADAVWPTVRTVDGYGNEEVVHTTRVDRSSLEGVSSNKRRPYAEHPFEPYRAPAIVINGLKKMAVHTDSSSGELSIKPVKNCMYPKEYDAFGVLKLIKYAYDSLDATTEQQSRSANGAEVVVNVGKALLIDNKSLMKIRIVMEPDTRKIITAIPEVYTPIMRLSSQRAREVLSEFVTTVISKT